MILWMRNKWSLGWPWGKVDKWRFVGPYIHLRCDVIQHISYTHRLASLVNETTREVSQQALPHWASVGGLETTFLHLSCTESPLVMHRVVFYRFVGVQLLFDILLFCHSCRVMLFVFVVSSVKSWITNPALRFSFCQEYISIQVHSQEEKKKTLSKSLLRILLTENAWYILHTMRDLYGGPAHLYFVQLYIYFPILDYISTLLLYRVYSSWRQKS